jgi:predicted DNA-binding ribbon-helix-helix protein
MTKLGRPKSTIKRITVSSHIKQDIFVQLAKIASKQRISISRLISNLLETDPELNKEN